MALLRDYALKRSHDIHAYRNPYLQLQINTYAVGGPLILSIQAVVAYTSDQIRDLLHLRQLFYSKVGQLCRERKALLRRMADEQDVGANIGLDDVSVRLSEVSDLAEQLRANGADEYKTYMQFSSAFSRGVSLSLFIVISFTAALRWYTTTITWGTLVTVYSNQTLLQHHVGIQQHENKTV